MIRANTSEYRELVRQKSIWDEFCKESLNARSRDEVRQAQEDLLKSRDAAYEAYRRAHGNPSGADLLALPKEAFQVFLTTGAHWLSMNYLNEFSDYGVTLIDSEEMEYVLPEDTTFEKAEAIKEAAPHWRIVTEDELWDDEGGPISLPGM